jgi:hypothetical protein
MLAQRINELTQFQPIESQAAIAQQELPINGASPMGCRDCRCLFYPSGHLSKQKGLGVKSVDRAGSRSKQKQPASFH